MARTKVTESDTTTIQVNGYEIFFNRNSHRFWRMENGKKISIPSVTSFTGIIDKSQQLIPWAVNLMVEHLTIKIGEITEVDIYEASQLHKVKKQEAADIGSLAHEWISSWLKGENPVMPDNPSVQQAINSFLEYQDQNNIDWIQSEEIVYYNDNGIEYAGIFDAIAKIKNKLVLVDFKSSNGIYPEYMLQAAGYQLAYEWMNNVKIDRRMIIRLAKETEEEYVARMQKKNYQDYAKYQSVEVREYKENLADQQAFIACVTLKNRLKEIEK